MAVRKQKESPDRKRIPLEARTWPLINERFTTCSINEHGGSSTVFGKASIGIVQKTEESSLNKRSSSTLLRKLSDGRAQPIKEMLTRFKTKVSLVIFPLAELEAV